MIMNVRLYKIVTYIFRSLSSFTSICYVIFNILRLISLLFKEDFIKDTLLYDFRKMSSTDAFIVMLIYLFLILVFTLLYRYFNLRLSQICCMKVEAMLGMRTVIYKRNNKLKFSKVIGLNNYLEELSLEYYTLYLLNSVTKDI